LKQEKALKVKVCSAKLVLGEDFLKIRRLIKKIIHEKDN